ncbi:hypothetical protein O181_058490 [Austropuccinia psidii MF-1]|uniref:Uncharacterized protein n=1 Tax=Austropuccinia psidii MF-1 TaxID=1389203 RepID=A0A9Q3E9T0_9BASI|nr:hypothetical protein [Austropuccinia psidii MF-1]
MSLLPESEIITLRGSIAGRKKVGQEIINMKEFYIQYIQMLLAKLGIHHWAPDLNNARDTLYNKECRINEIQLLFQIAVAEAYEYMNINLEFLNSIHLREASYSHYVHWLMAESFIREVIETGRFEKDEESEEILQARKRIEVGDNDESSASSISEVKSDEEDIEISEEDMDDINSGKELEDDPSFFIDRDTEMNNTDGPSTFASGSKDVGFSNE